MHRRPKRIPRWLRFFCLALVLCAVIPLFFFSKKLSPPRSRIVSKASRSVSVLPLRGRPATPQPETVKQNSLVSSWHFDTRLSFNTTLLHDSLRRPQKRIGQRQEQRFGNSWDAEVVRRSKREYDAHVAALHESNETRPFFAIVQDLAASAPPWSPCSPLLLLSSVSSEMSELSMNADCPDFRVEQPEGIEELLSEFDTTADEEESKSPSSTLKELEVTIALPSFQFPLSFIRKQLVAPLSRVMKARPPNSFDTVRFGLAPRVVRDALNNYTSHMHTNKGLRLVDSTRRLGEAGVVRCDGRIAGADAMKGRFMNPVAGMARCAVIRRGFSQRQAGETKGKRRSRVLVTLLHDLVATEICGWMFEDNQREGDEGKMERDRQRDVSVVVVLAPPGTTMAQQAAFERLFYDCRRRRRQHKIRRGEGEEEDVFLLWHRADDDAHALGKPPSNVLPFLLPEKDVMELGLQTLLLLTRGREIDADAVSSEERRRSDDALLRFRVLARRTRYDPDHFAWALPSSGSSSMSMMKLTQQQRAEGDDKKKERTSGTPLVLELPRGEEKSPSSFSPFVVEREFGALDYDADPAVAELIFEANNTGSLLREITTQELYDPSNPSHARYKTAPPATDEKGKRKKRNKKKKKPVESFVGNLSYLRFGYHTENTDHISDVAVRFVPSPSLETSSQCVDVFAQHQQQRQQQHSGREEEEERHLVFFHYPWVRDNIYHQHNDNILPLLLAKDVIEGAQQTKEPTTANSSSSSLRCTFVLLSSHRTEKPLPMFSWILNALCGGTNRSTVLDLSSLSAPSSCFSFASSTAPQGKVTTERLVFGVWGRPARPFSLHPIGTVLLYQKRRIVPKLRRLVHEAAATTAPQTSTSEDDDEEGVECRNTIRITILSRKGGGKRELLNEPALVMLLLRYFTSDTGNARPLFEIRYCCDGSFASYEEQVGLMANDTDILLGVHGAGLLHLIHLDPAPRAFCASGVPSSSSSSSSPSRVVFLTPLVVHVASRRLNYHEQVVIERLALLADHPREALSKDEATRKRRTTTGDDSVFAEGGGRLADGIRYMHTRTNTDIRDETAAWQESFSLRVSEMHLILEHMLFRFFSGV